MKKKLLLLFVLDDSIDLDNYIILCQPEIYESIRSEKRNVFCTEQFIPQDNIIVDELNSFILKFCENSIDKRIKDAFLSNINGFYIHILRLLAQWDSGIKSLYQTYFIEEIVFSDLVEGDYVTFYESEGEIQKRLFYKRYDFLPGLILQTVKKRRINYSIINKRHKLFRYFRSFMRRDVLLFGKFCLYLFKSFPFKKKNINFNYEVISLTRGTAHTHYMEPVLKEIDNSALFYFGGLYRQNLKNNINFPTIDGVDFLVNTDIVKSYLKCARLLFSARRVEGNLTFLDFELPLNTILPEMLVSWYDSMIYSQVLETYFKGTSVPKLVISNEMLTHYPFAVQELSNRFSFSFIQIQAVSLTQIPVLNFISSDLFVFNNKSDFEFFNFLLNSEKMAYWGQNRVPKPITKSKSLNNIIFFTQPYENENESNILLALKSQVGNSYNKLYIKLHPRDQRDKYNSLMAPNVEIIESDINISHFEKNADLCIIRTSSIAVDLMFCGLPTIFILNTPYDQQLEVEYILKNKVGVFMNIEDLISQIKEGNTLLDNAFNYTEEYRNLSGLKKERISTSLKEYIECL